MAKFVIDANMVEESHPILGDTYTYANGHGHTDNAIVIWLDVCFEGRKMFSCTVVPDSVNVFTYDDGERVTSVWDLVRA